MLPPLLDRLTALACALLMALVQPGAGTAALQQARAQACEAMPPGLAAPLGAAASRLATWLHRHACIGPVDSLP